MNSALKPNSRIKNQKGQITVDFLFSIVLAFGLGAIFFAFVLTLTVSEITQYVTFSAARAQAGADATRAAQCENAIKKYKELTGASSVLGAFYLAGWFKIDAEPDIRSGRSEDGSGSCKDETFADIFAADVSKGFSKVYTGVSTKFSSLLLDFNIPFVGKTDAEGEGFNTNVTSILIREPSHTECQIFFRERANRLRELPSGEYFGDNNSFQAYVIMEDNGC